MTNIQHKEHLFNDLYKNREYCKKCPNIKQFFVPIWQYGADFEKSKYKIMFVGKTARDGNWGLSETYDIANNLKDNGWAYWRYTREIYERLEGDNAWEKIAFSNMLKCNNHSTQDTSDNETKECCILKNQFIKQEIKMINPNHIIFYTSKNYDYYIRELFAENLIDIKEENKQIGRRNVNFWHFNIIINNRIIHCLRAGHPERKNKRDFIEYVEKFITNTNKLKP